MYREPVLRLLAGCGLAALLAGCAGPAAGPELGLSGAEVLQYRRDAALGVVQVRLVPERDVRVDAVRLVSARFPDAPQELRDGVLRAGRPVALPVPHGPPDCSAPAGSPVEAEVALEGVLLRLEADPAALDRVADRLCAAAALARAAEVGVEGVVPRGAVLEAVLVLSRREARGPVAVTGFGGNVLLAVAPAGPLPSLAPGQAQASVPLRITPARCDGHALAESKQTSVFRVFLSVDGGEPQQVLARPAPAERSALERWVVDACR